jgi:phosphoserine phosphatase
MDLGPISLIKRTSDSAEAKKHHPIVLVVFDMDGVLVDIRSSWQFIHERFGAENSDSMRRYLEGEISYLELMKRDIALWGRVHIDRIRQILSTVPLMPGATEMMSCLKQSKLRTAIISAGVSILAERLQTILGLDHVFANKILTDQNGFVTGEGQEIVSLLDKASTLNRLASEENIDLNQCVVVGDSVYDIALFGKAGVGIAFNPDSEKVSESADIVITKKDLREVLPCLSLYLNSP